MASALGQLSAKYILAINIFLGLILILMLYYMYFIPPDCVLLVWRLIALFSTAVLISSVAPVGLMGFEALIKAGDYGAAVLFRPAAAHDSAQKFYVTSTYAILTLALLYCVLRIIKYACKIEGNF